jgi:light-regulated signal transduction histidine kinase (bacteriophytochrome)
MGRLVEDFLNFSRTSRSGMRRDRVDMKALVETALGLQLTKEEAERTDVRIGDLPPALGDETLLRAAVQNLLSNAIKFSSKRPRRVLEIGWTEAGYFVRDNGVGIDPENAEKIFSVSPRLHARKEFEGNGIGLALVKRVVERHGGRVWAEGVPGEGATFWFQLPGWGEGP